MMLIYMDLGVVLGVKEEQKVQNHPLLEMPFGQAEQNWFHSSSVIRIPQKTSLARRAS